MNSKLLILSVIGLICVIAVLQYFNNTYIKAEFQKTDPMPSKMGVYYKGYKLGTTRDLKISPDFSRTYLYITLNQRGLHLPKNISVEVKNYDEDTKYVDIIYPTAPMLKYIKTGDVIKGESVLRNADGISDANQAHLDNLSEKGENLLTSAAKTTQSLTDLFTLIFEILNENRENLYSSTSSLKNGMENLEKSTADLKDLTGKINNEITNEIIRNSASNVEIITGNLAQSTKGFISVTDNFTKTSSDFSVLIPKLSDLIDSAQILSCNANTIAVGLLHTLRQRMGGLRAIFGKAIK